MKPITTDSDDKLLLNLSLGRMTFLSLPEKKKVSKNLDSSHDLALLSIEDIESLIGRNFTRKVAWNGGENLRAAERAAAACRRIGADVLLWSDGRYPRRLLQLSDAPFLLFCRGNVQALRSEKTVSVVGTRRLSPAGKAAARQFGFDAAEDGCAVVSGLANGADGQAHRGAVEAWFCCKAKGGDADALGKTVAVLPSSIDEVVPAANKKLAADILQGGGCLVSEYEPGIPVANWHFVARNRIIAGLSAATVVIEAPAGSGALITADFALEAGRDVMFHEAAFGAQAKQISSAVKAELDAAFARGAVSRYKRENTPEKYLEAGAPVIKDYKDFCACLAEPPGTRANPPEQLALE